MYWLIATSLLIHTSTAGTCDEAMKQGSEDDALKVLKDTYDVTDACYSSFISRNWWKAADLSLTKAYEMGFPLLAAKEETSRLKETMDSFVDLLEAGYKVLSPAFEWAESPTKVFLNVKFSHRIDAPGCIAISDPKVQMGADYILLTAFCKDPTFKYRAVLNLNLFDKVDMKESRFSLGSVGHIILSLEKADQPKAWGALLSGKKPTNMHIWWEMKEIYDPDMEKLRKKDEE